ncbi:hypothetical protein [Paenibacillus gansuensis]|uniref:Bactofilin n=1 Tax=Paenibacillus gansuensis TaxID=306542 RepID=A0ABW5PGS3_9BACL
MNAETSRDLKITGNGSTSGGRFRHVTITGEGDIHGALHCEQFKCTGRASIQGSVESTICKVNGEVRVEGSWRGKELHFLGQFYAKSGIQGDRLKFRGDIQTGGSCEAETISWKGGGRIKGMLNAEEIRISLYGPCQAKEIGGSRIDVRKNTLSALKDWLHPSGKPELQADLIEGDELYLEYTQAKIVRGSRVTIGNGCSINTVEYKESLKVHAQAVVEVRRKV